MGRPRRERISGRRGIKQRCKRVESRATIGRWEGNTVIGLNHKGAIMTLVERNSGFILAAKVAIKDAAKVVSRLIDMLVPYKALVKTNAFDNGRKISHHAAVSQAVGCKIFFSDPYSSLQRGKNENFSGLLR